MTAAFGPTVCLLCVMSVLRTTCAFQLRLITSRSRTRTVFPQVCFSTKKHANDDKDEREAPPVKSDNANPALHELEHRVKHAGNVEGIKLLADQLARKLETGAGRSVAEQSIKRAAERRTSELLAKDIGEHLLEKSADRLAERAAYRVAERALERSAEKRLAGSLEKAAAKQAERIMDQSATRAIERGTEKTMEKVTARQAERLLDQSSTRSMERSIERALEVGERGAEASLAKVASSSGAAVLERSLFTATGRRLALQRLARGAMIAVPVLGGIFAIYLLRSDIIRTRQEWQRNSSDFTWIPFAGAGLADGADSLCHFAIAFSLVTNVFSHQHLHFLESFSLACAVWSTVLAVGGEIFCQIKTREQKEQETTKST